MAELSRNEHIKEASDYLRGTLSEGLADEMAHRLPGSEPTPAQAFDDTHLDDDVQAALKALPPEYRAAVVLCDIEGFSYEEIAATLGVKLG